MDNRKEELSCEYIERFIEANVLHGGNLKNNLKLEAAKELLRRLKSIEVFDLIAILEMEEKDE